MIPRPYSRLAGRCAPRGAWYHVDVVPAPSHRGACPPRRSWLLSAWLGVPLAVLGACSATAQRPAVTAPTVASAPAPASPALRTTDASGVWDWILRSTTQQGDVQIEQEEWHLDQQDSRLSGYYHRQVVTMSSDQRPFQCNGMLGFTKHIRARLAGEIRDGQVALREVGLDTEPNPCDNGQRSLLTYVGRLQGEELLLQFNSSGEQRLVRRPPGSSTLSLAGSDLGPRGRNPHPQEPIDGVWEWQFRAVDADGDLHSEREEWHLSEKSAEIAGYYERTIERQRVSGVFACNSSPQIRSTTRFTIKGQRFGDKLSISEIDYQLPPSPCESGQRRLDSYQGSVLPEGQLLLNWSGGHQILRRKR